MPGHDRANCQWALQPLQSNRANTVVTMTKKVAGDRLSGGKPLAHGHTAGKNAGLTGRSTSS